MSQNSAFLEPLLRTQNNSIGPAWLQNQSTIEAKWAQNDILGRQREVLGATGPPKGAMRGARAASGHPEGPQGRSRSPTWRPQARQGHQLGPQMEPK